MIIFLLVRTCTMSFLAFCGRWFQRQQPMTISRTTGIMAAASLNDFLVDHRDQKATDIVIGNAAGDADSIVSAIALAYIESTCRSSMDHPWKTPVVSIPRADLETQRPETMLLMHLAGLSRKALESLLYIDDAVDFSQLNVTLVDHNSRDGWNVVGIWDHHLDEGKHKDTSVSRVVAFEKEQALVASTCTLVAERMEDCMAKPYPVSLGVMLLGVILLDSVNMSPQAGKVTDRDRKAVQQLLQGTDWKGLSHKAQATLHVDTTTGQPDTTAFFDALQNAKFDIDFWKGLMVRDALRLDYKTFGSKIPFGVSTVLMPMEEFFHKHGLVSGIFEYMQDNQISLLGIMFAYVNERGHLCRQLALCATEGFSLEPLVEFMTSDKYDGESLELSEMDVRWNEASSHDGLHARFFAQGNSKSSRKQIVPIMLDFFGEKATQ